MQTEYTFACLICGGKAYGFAQRFLHGALAPALALDGRRFKEQFL